MKDEYIYRDLRILNKILKDKNWIALQYVIGWNIPKLCLY